MRQKPTGRVRGVSCSCHQQARLSQPDEPQPRGRAATITGYFRKGSSLADTKALIRGVRFIPERSRVCPFRHPRFMISCNAVAARTAGYDTSTAVLDLTVLAFDSVRNGTADPALLVGFVCLGGVGRHGQAKRICKRNSQMNPTARHGIRHHKSGWSEQKWRSEIHG